MPHAEDDQPLRAIRQLLLMRKQRKEALQQTTADNDQMGKRDEVPGNGAQLGASLLRLPPV